MKAFISIFVISWLVTFYMPWWVLFIPAFLFGAWMLSSGLSAFFAGFLGTGLAWFIHAFYVHFANDAIISTRIAEMMGAGSPRVVLLLTFLVGAIPGGLGSLAGYLVQINLKPSKAAEPA